jgi:hypothetical protein
MLYMEIMAVPRSIQSIQPKLTLNIQCVPRSKHTPSLFKKKSVNAVYGNNRCLFRDPHKTHKLCGQNVEFMNVKLGGIYSKHWALLNG